MIDMGMIYVDDTHWQRTTRAKITKILCYQRRISVSEFGSNHSYSRYYVKKRLYTKKGR